MITVTAAHLQAGFAAMHWTGWTYTAAMADPLRSRLVRARAARLAADEFKASHQRTTRLVRARAARLAADEFKASHQRTTRLVRRFNPVANTWATQRVPGAYSPEPVLFSANATPTQGAPL